MRMPSSRTLFILAGALVLLAGLRFLASRSASGPEVSWPSGGAPELEALRQRKDVNVVFLLIDALRADRLGAAGYARPTSPNLDALAQGGVRFSRAWAQSSWTKTSMASLLTSTYPATNGILRWEDTTPEAATLPAEIFHAAGFRTVGLVRNAWMDPSFGFAQGFDRYQVPVVLAQGAPMRRNGPTTEGLEGSDLDLTQAATAFLDSFGQDRFFLYLHYMDVHQYASDASSPTFGTSHADFYDSAITWVDRNVGALVAELGRKDLLGKTLIVVASDHGEAFLEHGYEGHGHDLHREVLEVPLLVVLPFRLAKRLVIDTPVQNVDVFPTVLDLLGLPPLPEAEGRSLVPLIRASLQGDPPPSELADRPAFADLDRTWFERGRAPERIVSVATATHQMIRPLAGPGEVELYDLTKDPREQQSLAAGDPALRDRLAQAAAAHVGRRALAWGRPPAVKVDRLRLEQLRALGYVVK